MIGSGRCPIVNTWWQTETGGIAIAPLPGVTPTKPGSATRPFPGIVADIVDSNGHSLASHPITENEAEQQGGYLVIKQPWPGMM